MFGSEPGPLRWRLPAGFGPCFPYPRRVGNCHAAADCSQEGFGMDWGTKPAGQI